MYSEQSEQSVHSEQDRPNCDPTAPTAPIVPTAQGGLVVVMGRCELCDAILNPHNITGLCSECKLIARNAKQSGEGD
jgi:hypothetical protein